MYGDGRSLWLDLIRGSSALLVCLGHLRNAILVDYSELVHPNILIKAFYALTSFGHQAVMVFFVLSGYFVGGAVLRAGSKFSWASYLTSRLTRLWVVLIPSLFITWFVGQILLDYAPAVLAGANVESWHSGPKPSEYSVDFSTLFANIFFLQTIVSPVFGLNSPLWSLANEFWYYMLFPLLAMAVGFVGSGKNQSRIAAFVFTLMVAWSLPSEMLYGFLIWMMGVAVYCLQPTLNLFSKKIILILLAIAFALFGLALVYSKLNGHTQILLLKSDFLIGVSFAFLCLILTRQSVPKFRLPWFAKGSLYLSELSYSLYLSHFPMVILIASIAYQSQKIQPTISALAQFFSWFLLLIGFGFAMWWLFESRTDIVRERVRAALNPLLIRFKNG
jgi:peptidoglycan/LPS O-acetylase OafA/YrhL